MAWGPDGPPREAYSRVTAPERHASLIAHADRVVDRLVMSYDVLAEPVEREGAVRAVRLTPTEGAPLVVGVTSFPGLVIDWGTWGTARFPDCGCDACDEQAVDQSAAFEELVEDVVAGRVSEHLERRHLSLRHWGPDREQSSRGLLHRDEAQALLARGAPGRRVWPAWPVQRA